MSFGDLVSNFDSVAMMGAGAVGPISVVGTASGRDDTERITSLNRRLPADCRSSTTDVSIPVRTATQAKTPTIARMTAGSMSVLDVDQLADDERSCHLEHERRHDHLLPQRLADERVHVI